MNMNAFFNSKNVYQDKYKRVLCLCSAGLLRSPTVALVLSQEPYNYNTRAAGVNPDYALIPVTPLLVHWADEIVAVTSYVADEFKDFAEKNSIELAGKELVVLDIPDQFSYRNQILIDMIKTQYDELLNV